MISASEYQWSEDGGFDLRALIRRVLDHRWLVLAIVVICSGLMTAIALLSTPVYRAVTVLMPANNEQGTSGLSSAMGQIGGLAALAGVTLGIGGSSADEYIAVLKSREFTERFINEKRLLPKLFSKQWDVTTGKWKVDEPPTPAEAYKKFNSSIRAVAYDKKTGLVTLQIEWKDRQEASDWANELVVRVNEEMRARATSRAEAYVKFLEREYANTNVLSTREAIGRLIESQVRQRMLANVNPEYAFRVVDRALPADRNDPVRPNKVLLIFGGPIVGLALGVLLVILLDAMRAPPERKPRMPATRDPN